MKTIPLPLSDGYFKLCLKRQYDNQNIDLILTFLVIIYQVLAESKKASPRFSMF